jgi:calcium-dependent protein kinase
LKAAFDFFDKDGSKSISVAELKEALGAKDNLVDDAAWENLVKEVDKDNNGEVDFEEFEAMMGLLVEQIPLKK